MDFDQQAGEPLFQLNLDASNSFTLRNAASWARVLGVVGIILGTIFAVLGIILLSQIRGYGYDQDGITAAYYRSLAGGRFVIWLMILTGGVFILGSIFSLVFGNRIMGALRSNDQFILNNAFASLRNYFALRSIVLIILLLLVLISFAVAL